MNVAAGHYVASASKRQTPSEQTSRIYRRLLIETALACGYPLRLQHRSRAGRCTIRIVMPVSLQVDGHTGQGLLTTRLIRQSHQIVFTMDEVDAISLAIEHMPADRTTAAGFSVGDAVRHEELGLGVVQAFERDAGRTHARVLFALHGEQRIEHPGSELEGLDSRSLGAGAGRLPVSTGT